MTKLYHFQIRKIFQNKWMMVRLTLFINANTKAAQIKHGLWPKYNIGNQ